MVQLGKSYKEHQKIGSILNFWENYGLITSYFQPRNLPILQEMYW
jgi:hypothetical protein